jgi:putative ABC transport system permease protein
MGTMMQDIRYGVRMLAKNPGFTVIAVITLALGIGANTAIFSVVNAELLRPLPYREPGKLVRLWETNSRTGSKSGSISFPDFTDWQAQNKVFEKIGVYTSASYTLTGVERPAHLEGQAISAELISLLGAAPELGRTFLPGEDEPQHHVAILSHRLWKEHFGGDPGIIGRTITLENSGYTVVGVMPASFEFPLQRKPVEIWTTFSALQEPSEGNRPITQVRGAHFMLGIARLKSGVTLEQAQSGMDAITASLANQYPDSNKYFGARLVPEQDEITSAIRPALLVLLIAVGVVLLIACVNVANLLLARATTRVREIAIRAALGAGRMRVVRQLLTESFLLALFAGTLGMLLAAWGIDVLVRLSPEDLPRVGEIHLDGRVLAFTAILSMLTGIIFGLAPALQITRTNLVDTLKESSWSATAGMHRHRLRSSLVVVEMALALVLLVSAGLLIHSFISLQSVNPGFNPRNVMASYVDLPDEKFSNAQKVQFMRSVMPRVKALPGVVNAAAIMPLPLSGNEFQVAVEIEGRPTAKSDEAISSVRSITEDYFRTMQIPLLQGREFKEQDSAETAPVVIVNEALAQKFFPGENPVGKHIRPGISTDGKPGRMREIVGVVGNVKHRDLGSEWTAECYIPFSQLPFDTMTIVARAANSASVLAKPIAEAVLSVDKDVPTFQPRTLADYLNGTIAIPRFNTLLLGMFAGLALVLTAVGLYGVISYSVAQRTHEIGIRMALGGQPQDMLRLVVGQGLRLGLIGVGLGLVAALFFTRFVSSLLFGITPADPVSYAGVIFLLLGVVLLACYIPARRAMRVDPMVALRYE